MSLFQHSVLKKYLQELDKQQVETAFKKYILNFGNPEKQNNIRVAKEEQYQEGFLRELFVETLGYTINPQPNYDLTTEYKNEKDAKKADGAILKESKPIAIIELKGTDTINLDTVEQQAFNYKNNQSNCKYIITSNFEKLRFYIENAIEYEEFNLFNLSIERFSLLFLCLSKDNLLNDIPLTIKQTSLTQEENVTKKLYSDYSTFKHLIYSNIVELNTQYDKLLLYKKTQKLLDRFLFIFFAEDRLLLPPNSIREILKQWEQLKELDNYIPLYDRYKKYFSYLNTGHKGKEQDIFAYNGGLFEPDEILDNIKIDDQILYTHTIKLSDYDYETDVDVNILGHIFEHSLSEIEEVQAELSYINNGLQPIVNTSKKVSKRKKDGIFYTPKYITKYIVDNTLGSLCDEKKKELEINEDEFSYAKRKEKRKELIVKLDTYRNWLLKLTICDPACGSGAFLNQALNYLIEEHKIIDELQAKVSGASIVFPDIENKILENNLYGVDLNEESVEIAKLSLWLRTAHKGRKLTSLNKNIKCGNSLIDDPAVVGDKAFNWQKEFPTVFVEKEKKMWHITSVTHDTRTSQRMLEYKVRERRADGEMHIDRSIYFNNEEAIKITEILCNIITEDKLNCLAYNVCNDHIHIILVCEEEELPNIVRKLKGKSAQKFKEYKGISKDETFNLWAQKYDRKEIKDEQQLSSTINYIQTNREKHQLPDINKGLQPLVKQMTCTFQHAFRTEYKGGFDVVIGNPPYGATLNEKDIQFFRKKYTTVIGHSEVYYLFTEKAIKDLIKNEGYIGLIIPNAWLSNKYARKLRELLIDETKIENLINFNRKIIFEDANVETAIVILKKITPKDENITLVGQDLENLYAYKQNKWKFNDNYLISFAANQEIDKIIIKINLSEYKLSDKLDISNGFKPYQVGYGINLVGKPLTIDDVNNKIYHSDKNDNQLFKKEIKGKGLNRYSFKWEESYINWGKWLMSPKSIHYFEQPKILIRQVISDYLFAFLDKEKYFADQSLYVCTNYRNKEEESLEFYLCLLNSRLYGFYFRKFYSEEDDLFPKIKVNELKDLPVKELSKEQQKPFIEKANTMLSKNKELQELKIKFIKLLSAKFPEIKISNKLENLTELDFKGFLKELQKNKNNKKKQGVATPCFAPPCLHPLVRKVSKDMQPLVLASLQEQSEWLEYFEKEKAKAQEIKAIIEKTDKEIDNMVYKLYELTDDEIKIIEQSLEKK